MSNDLDLTFDTPEPIDLYVENGRGLVDVTATDTGDRTTVRITGERAEEYDVRDLGDGREPHRIAIIAPPRSGGIFGKDPRAEIFVEVPVASALTAKVGSSDVRTHGRLADTRVECGSGDVWLDVVDGDTVVQSGSGDVQAEHLAGDARHPVRLRRRPRPPGRLRAGRHDGQRRRTRRGRPGRAGHQDRLGRRAGRLARRRGDLHHRLRRPGGRRGRRRTGSPPRPPAATCGSACAPGPRCGPTSTP